MITKYPKLTGYSKFNDRIRENQQAVKIQRVIAGPGIILRETAGGTIITADVPPQNRGRTGAAVWL